MKKICENPEHDRKLGLSEDGRLCVLRGGDWQDIGFNERYSGEYPACTFQDIMFADEDFFAAGTTTDGMAAVYSSLAGETWTPVSLKEQHYWTDGKPPRGGALRLFYEPCMNQILLVCTGGDIVIIPECPKCVRIMRAAGSSEDRSAAERTIADAEYKDHRMMLTYEDGETESVPVATADRIRVSMSYAINACNEGRGELIDIRPDETRREEGPIPCTAAIDPGELDDYLENKDPDTGLYFVCNFGTIADQAAWHAYHAGFTRARSIGGYYKGMHID